MIKSTSHTSAKFELVSSFAFAVGKSGDMALWSYTRTVWGEREESLQEGDYLCFDLLKLVHIRFKYILITLNSRIALLFGYGDQIF